jgi:molybdenum cofactor biosynthesis enzyme MoaA
MAKLEVIATAPARLRHGIPVIPDGSPRHPLLLRLPDTTSGPSRSCNNGCRECLTQPVEAPAADARGQHVVLRDREPTLRRDLPAIVADLKRGGAASIALLTNGRRLGYAAYTSELVARGVDRFVVKLFGYSAGEHDAHTREPGSFDQALRGIAVARALGARVFVTFPLPPDASNRELDVKRRRAMAKQLTGLDHIEMPEPEVETHAGEYRFDLIRRRGDLSRTYFAEAFFPMVHVNTGPACNIRCVYCNVHGGADQRLYPADYIMSVVDVAAEHVRAHEGGGRPTMDFIGGEPTLHPDLPKLVEHAKKTGFEQVTICTNGVLLLKPGYLDSLIAAGLTGVRYSFHDHRAEMANRLADVPGLGPRYVEVATALLSRRDLQTHLFRILLTETIDALPDYIRWLAAHNHTGRPVDLTLGMPSMRGRMFENRELYPALAALRPAVESACALASSLGFELSFHHTPGCLLPGQPEVHACLHVETTQVESMAGRTNVMNFEGDARYVDACATCSGKGNGCHGLPAHYVESDRAAAEAWVVPHAYLPSRGRRDPAAALRMGG